MNHVLLLLLVVSCATVQKKPATKAAPKSGDLVSLDHKWFKVHYDPKIKLARYVEYTLERRNLTESRAKRRNKFLPDPILVKSGLPHVGRVLYSYRKKPCDFC